LSKQRQPTKGLAETKCLLCFPLLSRETASPRATSRDQTRMAARNRGKTLSASRFFFGGALRGEAPAAQHTT